MKTSRILLFVSFIIVLTFSSFINVDDNQNNPPFVVVLDAGHGGKDPGKPSKYGFKEKDIALKIVLEIGKQLEKHPNIKVIYTRKKDVFIELKERARIANKANADLFVSIHCNAHHSQAYGTETYVLGVANTQRNLEVAKAENEVIYLEDNHEEAYKGFDPSSPESLITNALVVEEYTEQSILLASLIEKNFSTKINRKSRGVKQASLWVIHQTAMPSVLVETGFLTNKAESYYLNSKKGQQEISKSISTAILEFKKSLESNIIDYMFSDDKQEIIDQVDNNYHNIVFKVQIAASSKALETKPYNFKGLNNISRTKENNLYKYFYGETSNYNTIKKLEEEAKTAGFKTGYIVAFKDGEKISLTEALKTTAN
ncbi:N-acetylmuramoyl-L-alanine amidase family protein [Hwangdonia lutea]|uniref:N-acetylmuramoyl-L-alanine amidase n=1 Tax=Hwangdonia lutea TaxID=3075823 RepID=A0AA97EL91_9FLAO|nr:N-acetylmuramoyl-L-alanine amidase [Hwangdonia sp. SCSIO 19198]WOD43499.1 N-acetylmuramoyl-L-alanine amidase [Hwangdonia sp. SCSIO 19198]